MGSRFSRRQPTGAALLLICGVALAGCSTAGQTSEQQAPEFADLTVITGAAKLDPVMESITLPVDQYGMTVLESHVIDYAGLLLQKECMAEQGVDFLVVKPFNSFDDPPGGNFEGGATPNHTWGLWSVDTASKWGYEDPPNELREALLAANGAPMAATDGAVADKCFKNVVDTSGIGVAELLGDDTTITYRAQFHTFPEDTPEGKKAYGDWVSCLEKKGLSPARDNPFIPAGALEMSKEDQISTALTDAKCKQETNMIQRLADIEAAYQEVFIDKNEAALVAWRKEIQAMVDDAEETIRAREG